jgi:hypothetical protein
MVATKLKCISFSYAYIIYKLKILQNGYVMSVSPTGSTTTSLPNLIEEIDVSKYLVKKKESEEGPEVKGGLPDALIIHATKAQKMSDGKLEFTKKKY